MNSLYGSFRQKTFSSIYDSVDTFIEEYNNAGINALASVIDPSGYNNVFNTSTLTAIYYLLYSRYGNSVIASSDINRFQEQLFSIVIQNVPAWLKKSQIQSKLRNLTEEEIETSYSSVLNTASNPNNVEDNNNGELPYISNQNVSKSKKGKINAYKDYLDILSNDYTEIFISKFKKLFLTVIQPEEPLLYESED
jgi:uncharacterized membrane-anchored protein YjiN (DUF445 family)